MFGAKRLRIGAAGHRLNQLTAEALPVVGRAVDQALAAIEAAAREACGKNVKLTLLSGLAEGTDRIAAEGALKRDWKLEAPLPFSIARYEKDFETPASVAEFQSLLKQADKVIPAPAHDGDNDAGYASVANAVSHDVDALVIVWNGAPPKGPGGTAEVAAKALHAKAPVIWISEDGARTRLILPEGKPAKLGKALAARFETTERPAELRQAEA